MIEIQKLNPSVEYGSNCYLISSSVEYAVIDPSADCKALLNRDPEIAVGLKYVLITHAHFDHMLHLDNWSKLGAKVIVGEEDGKALADSTKNCYLGFLGVDDGYYGEYDTVSDGEVLRLGNDEIKVISCPGHTAGGVSYQIGDNIFCGDTVFAGGGYGRCDLPGGDITVLEKTIIKLITHLSDNVVFYPGHGPETTLRDMIYHFM